MLPFSSHRPKASCAFQFQSSQPFLLQPPDILRLDDTKAVSLQTASLVLLHHCITHWVFRWLHTAQGIEQTHWSPHVPQKENAIPSRNRQLICDLIPTSGSPGIPVAASALVLRHINNRPPQYPSNSRGTLLQVESGPPPAWAAGGGGSQARGNPWNRLPLKKHKPPGTAGKPVPGLASGLAAPSRGLSAPPCVYGSARRGRGVQRDRSTCARTRRRRAEEPGTEGGRMGNGPRADLGDAAGGGGDPGAGPGPGELAGEGGRRLLCS